MTEVRDELVRAKTVFIEKITEQARQICWVRAVVYSKVSLKEKGKHFGITSIYYEVCFLFLLLEDK